MTDLWSSRLSEYIDGELSDTETRELEQHILTCAECRRDIHELRSVVSWLGQDTVEEPSKRAWTRIESALVPHRPRKGWLIAASVVLVAGATTLFFLRPAGERPTVSTDRTSPVANVAQKPYDRAVTELEAILRANGETLDPATVAVIQRSLGTINKAIAEAEAALAADSAHEFVPRYLDHLRTQKMKTLREAAVLARATRGS